MRISLSLALATVLLTGSVAAQTARFRDEVFTSVLRTNDITYGSAVNAVSGQSTTLLLDRYEPDGDLLAARPAIVVIHGGGFVQGDKGDTNWVTLCDDFARRGYLAVSINYRLVPSGTPAGMQGPIMAREDAKAAVRFLRANAAAWGVDSERIAVMGGSAGAIASLHVAYVPGEGNSGNAGWPSDVAAVVDLWGQLSNISDMEAGEAPVCIIHGTDDTVVPYSSALALEAQAQLVGVPYVFHPLQGSMHAPWNLLTQFRPVFIAFLYEHLKVGQISGLAANPGFASPGSITLDSFGVAGDSVILAVAGVAAAIEIDPLGTLCLEPSVLYIAEIFALGSSELLPAHSSTFALPAGLGGATLYWQTGHQAADGSWRLLTNCVTTAF